MLPSLRSTLRAVAPLSLVACSAASKPASAPAPAAPLTTIEEAEAELSRAEASLPRVTAPGAGATAASPLRAEEKPADPPKDREPALAPTGGATPARPSPPAKAARDGERDEAHRRADDGEATPTPCQTACRALASMRRAADAVCRLAGDGDARCVGAQRRVDAATARVAHCGCAP